MIIEITGVPCAGKTTLLPYIYRECSKQYNKTQYASDFLNALALAKLDRLAALLPLINTQKPTKILRNLMILFYFVSSFFVYLRLHIFALKFIYNKNRTFKAIRSYYWKFGKYYTIKHNIKDQCIIIDEGPVHVTQSIFVSSVDKLDENLAGLQQYLELAPLPDLLIVIHNRNRTELLERFEKRGHHRATSHAFETFIDNCIKTEDAAINILTEKKDLAIKILPTGNIENKPLF